MARPTPSDKSERVKAAQFKAATSRINDLRKRLLDLSNSNKMLSFRHGERSRTHVRVIDEILNALLARLKEGDALTFRSLPEPDNNPEDEKTSKFLVALEEARVTDEIYLQAIQENTEDLKSRKNPEIERALKDRVRRILGMPLRPSPDCMSIAEYAKLHGLEPSYDLTLSSSTYKRHLDSEIQTLLLPDEMGRKLSGLTDRIKTILQETGVNTLYCAFGFLEWYESASSDKVRLAPLLLHPVEIERRLVRSTYKYSITSIDEETQVNITLAARLAKDFGLKLPELSEGELPEDYFKKVEKVIKQRKRWQVRRFITIGHFAFARLVMYNDLNPDNWPDEASLSRHAILAELLGGSERREAYYAEEYDVDDPEIAKAVPVLITDADSSQFSAIVDVMSGKNLVIKGPPGTGKSQTITNIIASAMAEGKSVLFVAEKMAALDVVKKRLDDAGIGDFCLESHSTRARKKDVLDALGKRLDLQERLRSPRALEPSINELEDLRHQLSSYVKLINQPFGSLGISIHDILWAEQRTRNYQQLPKSINNIELRGAESLTTFDTKRDKELLQALSTHWQGLTTKFQSVEHHPWRGVMRGDLSPYEQEDLCNLVSEWGLVLRKLRAIVTEIAEVTGEALCESIESIERLASKIDSLPEPASSTNGLELEELLKPEAVNALKAVVDDLSTCRGLLEQLATTFPGTPPTNEADRIGVCALEAERLNLKSKCLAELVGVSQKLFEDERRWRRLSETSQELLRLFGISDAATIRACWLALQAAAFLRTINRKILLLRNSGLTNENSAFLIEAAAEKHGRLCKQLTEFGERYHLPVHDHGTSARLKGYAKAIRNAGMFSWFNKEVRIAKAAYTAIRLRPTKLLKHQAADELERIAQLLDEIDAFSGDERLRQICAGHFNGMETVFGDLIQVIHYSWNVRKTFPGSGSLERTIRECLLEGKIDILDEISAFDIDVGVEQDESTADLVGASNNSSVHEYAFALKKKAQDIERLGQELASFRLKESTVLGVLPDIAEKLRSLRIALGKLETNNAAKKVLGQRYKGIDTPMDVIKEVLRIAEAVHAAKCPDALSRCLLTKDYAKRLLQFRNYMGKARDLVVGARDKQAKISELGGFDSVLYFGAEPDAVNIDELITRLAHAIEHADTLASWVNYIQTRHQAEARGLGPLLKALQSDSASFRDVQAAYDRTLYRTLCKRAFAVHPSLVRFNGVSQEQARCRFQILDKEVIKLYQKNLAASLASRDLEQGVGYGQKRNYSQRALIENERSKQRRHIPIRELLRFA